MFGYIIVTNIHINKCKKQQEDQEERTMEVVNILHMKPGDGELSYANNSELQESVIEKELPVLKYTIKGIFNEDRFSGQCFKIADLGCSSGKNTLLAAANMMDMVIDVCKENNRKPPHEFQVFLNDLFGNDFNSLFKLLPDFYANLIKKDKGEKCFVSAVPGSFYSRLFPEQSLHLVHSACSVHWLSQIPGGLESNGLNIHIAKTSPLNVLEAYEKQFKTDFKRFLQTRSEEIVCGGRMVLTTAGRGDTDATRIDNVPVWEVLAQSLLDMVKEGRIQESDLRSFNVPEYYPCEDELVNVIQNEGSFSLESLTGFYINWDPHDTDYKNMYDSKKCSLTHGENTTKVVRAFMEPLLISHFGESIIDELFKKYTKRVTIYLSNNKPRFYNFVISLAKK